jgi:hypothetical protein
MPVQRGRKSAASLATVTPIVDHRPPAPDDMPEAQAELWQQIVNRLPHDWFKREHLELLRAYVQHVTIARELARQIEQFRPEWLTVDGGLQRLDGLTRMLDREHRIMLALARSMRITHQSQYDKTYAGKQARDAPGHGRPWDTK